MKWMLIDLEELAGEIASKVDGAGGPPATTPAEGRR